MAKTEYVLSNGLIIKARATRNGITTAFHNDYHYKYRIVLSVVRNGFLWEKTFTFHDSIFNYQRNTPFTEKSIDEALDCILMDGYAYANNKNLYEFCREFGWDDRTAEGRKAFNGCMDTWYKLTDLLEEDELEEFNNIIYNKVNN